MNHHIPVIAIGASAGGLNALKEFFAAMPVENGMAFVVITHRQPGQTNLLPEILSHSTSMKITEIVDDVIPQANHIYITPAEIYISMQNGKFKVQPTSTPNISLPIDSFFRSLAHELKEKSICVVLSGTSTDGTLGLQAVKGEGGMAMAQSIKTAEFTGMPGSAIDTGLVDYVLKPGEMPDRLVEYVTQLAQGLQPEVKNSLSEVMGEIMALLRQRTGNDFSFYKPNTLGRRIERRMNIHQIMRVKDYVRYLRENSHETELLFKELLIGVTSFFRDEDGFDLLASLALPKILSDKNNKDSIRVWIAGCSTGEEAYSTAILIQEYMEQKGKNFAVQIFATDLDEKSINHARAGLYAEGIALDVSAERLEKYFIREDGHYRVKKSIREMVIFAVQNLIQDPPFTKLNMVSCRNLLIYIDAHMQKKILPMFHYSLVHDGILFLGSSETIGTFTELFTPLHTRWKIFIRKDSPLSANRLTKFTEFSKMEDATYSEVTSGMHTLKGRAANITDLAQKLLLKQFIPPSVVVNEKGDVFFIHGKTGAYLEPSSGSTQQNHNIFDMSRDGLQLPLAAIIRKAANSDEQIFQKNVKVKIDGRVNMVCLSAQQINEPEALRGLIWIAFEPETGKIVKKAGAKTDVTQDIENDQLERELQFIKQNLQNTIEELEAANEELKSTNEELQSTNEELQSANEELETAKEEMQSLNEELTTVNVELETKINDLSYSNDDMKNLLNSTGIATIFLDNNLHIKRFTDKAKKIVNLIPSDIGRPISDIVTQLEYNKLEEDAAEVLQTLVYKEIEVRANDWSWYLMRILPYRTADNVIDGLVLIFVDITRVKKSEILLASHNTAMEVVLQNLEVEEISEKLIRTIEAQSSGIWCSVSFYDEKAGILRHGAAPNLPDAFNKVLDGIKVNAEATEPCAMAVFHKKTIIISDIPNEVDNTEFDRLALKYHLKACWSQPIYTPEGQVLGVFTIYYKKAHQPSVIEEDLINQTVPLIGIAVHRKRSLRSGPNN